MQQQNYFNIIHPADTSGCGFYRMKTPYMAVQNMNRNVLITDSCKMITNVEFYRGVRHVRVQRQVSNAQLDFLIKFLLPLSKKLGFWLSYEIDDVITPEDIPMYNMGRSAFQVPGIKENISALLKAVDFITVTTERLAQHYAKVYNIDINKFKVVPNYLPHWWIGGIYNEQKISDRIKNMKKPHIVFAGSTTHVDAKNMNNGIDDYTHIIPFIEKNINKYKFTFVGLLPNQILQYAKDKKVTYISGFDLLNYPKKLDTINADLFIAPLQNNEFNLCKSNIKLLEAWAMGIPILTQNLPLYSNYTDQVFDNHMDLDVKVEKLLGDKTKLLKLIKDNYKIVDDGDINSKNGWWLENNISFYIDIFTLPQKKLEYDLEIFNG